MQKRILIVEDEAAIRDMVAFALRKADMFPVLARDADEAQIAIADAMPDLVLLDWMLPGISGMDLARQLRKDETTRDLPIIMLTARDQETDRVAGFEAGADDYVGKPFSTRELLARIKAVLRRSRGESNEGVIKKDRLHLDSQAHRVSVDDEQIHLGPTEYRLLQFLMTHSERVYSRAQLLDHVWGSSVYVEDRTVDVSIRRLRKALEPWELHTMIQTVRGAGYRFSVHTPSTDT